MTHILEGELVTDFVNRYKYTSNTSRIYFICLEYLFAEKTYQSLDGEELILTF